MMPGKKAEPPFGLGMDFHEALTRFVETKPAEVVESIEASKQEKPPGATASSGETRSQRVKVTYGRTRKPKVTKP